MNRTAVAPQRPRLPLRPGAGFALGCAAIFLSALAAPERSSAQISLSTAVELSLQNNPKVKLAESDLARAKDVLAETKEVYIPAIATTAGVGKATGAPLEPPVVFSIAAQSLVFSFSQRDYIRAAHSGVASAQLALEAARTDVSEDTVNTYVALDNALQRRAVQDEALAVAQRLALIAQDRFSAGVDPHIELTKARLTEAQIRLKQLLLEDEITEDAEHLASVTGLPATGLHTEHSSIPAMQTPTEPTAGGDSASESRTQGISAAFAAADAKRYTAHGDRRYVLHPQLSFSANYSRISTAFTTYAQYYPQFGNTGNSFNSLGVGVQITLPLLDMVHRAKTREAAEDASHAFFDAQVQQNTFLEGRRKLRHSTAELAAREQLATLDHDLAQDQLDAIRIRLGAAAGSVQGEQMTPKDQENALLQERQRTIDMLSADLQLRQAEVTLMRQEGSLANWLSLTLPGAPGGGAAASRATTVVPGSPVGNPQSPDLPPTVGTEPASAPPVGTSPPEVPTSGTLPANLPGAPVANPAPPATPAAPPAAPHL